MPHRIFTYIKVTKKDLLKVKTVKAIITIGIALFLFGGSIQASAQATAYANIYARVVAPVGFSKTTDMSFNDIILSKKSGSISINSVNSVSSDLKMSQNGTATPV